MSIVVMPDAHLPAVLPIGTPLILHLSPFPNLHLHPLLTLHLPLACDVLSPTVGVKVTFPSLDLVLLLLSKAVV